MAASASASAGLPLVLVADVDLPGGATRFDYQELAPGRGQLVIAHMNDNAVVIVDLRDGSLRNLKRADLHLKQGYIDLAPQDTKTEEGRRVYLSRTILPGSSPSTPASLSVGARARESHVDIDAAAARM